MKLEIIKLKKYFNDKGSIFEGIKNSDSRFAGFGEIYFSEVYQGEIKGWKQHKRMTMNLIVIMGTIKFFLVNEKSGEMFKVCIGNDNYSRIVVPPMYWMAFKGVDTKNILCNLASIEHDPEEQTNKNLNHFDINSNDFFDLNQEELN